MKKSVRELREEFLTIYGYVPIMGGAPDDDGAGDGDGDDPENDGGDGNDPDTKGRDQKKGLYTSEEVEATVRRRLRRQKETFEAQREQAIKDEVAKVRAKDNEDYRSQLDLANKELEKLKGVESILARFVDLADEQFDKEFDKLPAALQRLAPDEDADPFTRQKWLNDALDAKAELEKESKDGESKDDPESKNRAKRGFNPKDAKQKQGDKENRLKSVVERFQTTGHYQPM